MSKLSDAIKAREVGRVPPPYSLVKYADITVKPVLESLPIINSVQYSVGVEVHARIIAEAGNVVGSVQVARRAVIEEVFGEFRRPLLMLRLAINNRDFEEADKLLNQVETDMFS